MKLSMEFAILGEPLTAILEDYHLHLSLALKRLESHVYVSYTFAFVPQIEALRSPERDGRRIPHLVQQLACHASP